MTSPLTHLAEALTDRYAVERELGRGGMATVYLARDLKHDRSVAVKVLHPELSASLGKERFPREISVTAGLTHPHILPLYDSGSAGDLLAGTYTVDLATISVPGGIVFSTPSKTVTLAESEVATVDFSGASWHTSPVGTGIADTWTVVQPTAAVSLCNGLGSSPCSGSTVTVTAEATGPSGMFPNPWNGGTVYFYYRDAGTGLHTYLAQVPAGLVAINDGTVRTYIWTATLDATGIPAGPLEIIAVGVIGGTGTATPANTNVTVVDGTP